MEALIKCQFDVTGTWRFRRICSTFPALLLFAVLVSNFSEIVASSERRSPTKRCAACDIRAFEEYKNHRQQQILNDLLKKLDLPAKPNVTVDYDNLPPIGGNNPRIKALIEQSRRESHRRVRKSTLSARRRHQNSRNDGQGADYFPELYETDPEISTQTSYIISEPAPRWFDQEGQVAFFSFSSNLRDKFVNKAVLNVLLRRPAEQIKRTPIRVDVFQRFSNGTLGGKLATKHDHISSDENSPPFSQVQIPLEALDVQLWIQPEESAYADEVRPSSIGLYIQAIYDDENIVIFPKQTDGRSQTNEAMFIELEIYDYGSGGRSRRNAPNLCQVGSNQTGCCLYDLIIDFEKVGWEFVIAPKRYNAYICNGECDPTTMAKSPMGKFAMDSHVDHFLCCHPKEYTGITIVYVDINNVIWIREVPNLVAKKCGCE